MSNVVTIDVKSCKPGMKISEEIINNYGAILVHKETILDNYTVHKLKSLGIDKIKVYEDYELKPNELKDNSIVYEEKMNEFKTIIKDLGIGKKLDTLKVQKIVSDLNENFTSINDIITNLKTNRSIDEYTYSHSLNVSLLCSLIGNWLGLSPVQRRTLSYCGLLHDIGKSKIPNEILYKPGPLTSSEFEEVKKHSVYGYKILEGNIAISKDVLLAVLMHHEREDGSGYPLGLKGDKISFYAKVTAIADMFDAMTSDRVYKKRQTCFDVFELFEREYLTKFDTNILLTFLNRISSYYVGSNVMLSNGSYGEVVFIDQKAISRPIIKLEDSSIVDLRIEKGLRVEEVF
ncbi:HD-GYP domain-containing protein [Lutispora thermophila]|uniref:HDIG domain-containing protein n=1 Tax=Lutispora thermophila DSM 19022 TaxID=1122184 RepID=A0A1M6FU60_9FIRM|nr:HD-GYP domain-containing protein [Lutispora thermophila]SHJ01242.1 HDIG domain-containing protein [Lutispora thermophila DSM 19022]